jgi:hypothetical protein
MAVRPIFIPKEKSVGVFEKPIDFKWHAGMAASQKKKSIFELHEQAKKSGANSVLEISSKSEVELGIQLSAFNLVITTRKHGKKLTVETAFQGSKVFERGGPYSDLYGLDSRAAKKDIRLKESGNLINFCFFGVDFPLVPRTYFYDWIYINALVQNESLAEEVKGFDAFSDIEFNPKKSINCQAHSVALYRSLVNNNLLVDALDSPDSFLSICQSHYDIQSRNIGVQSSII